MSKSDSVEKTRNNNESSLHSILQQLILSSTVGSFNWIISPNNIQFSQTKAEDNEISVFIVATMNFLIVATMENFIIQPFSRSRLFFLQYDVKN